jgi:hypothetical protein
MHLLKVLFDSGLTTPDIKNAMDVLRACDVGGDLKNPPKILRTIGPNHEEDIEEGTPLREDFLVFDEKKKWRYFNRSLGEKQFDLDPLGKSHFIANLTRIGIDTGLLIDLSDY